MSKDLPDYDTQMHDQQKQRIVVGELEAPDWGGPAYSDMPFDTRVTIDDKVLAFFDPENGKYHPCYMPLEPFCSSTLATGLFTEDELRRIKRKLNKAKAEAQCLAEKRVHYFNINSITDHIECYLLGNARKGFKLKQLTEHRKTLRLLEPERKKRKWWPF